ncbi:MAG: hypothetical protein IIY81_09670 [Lachnospiraceae bacterium]|jgi:DNA-directed RNA polymerase specialized sigma24 family protein|nr:hypothetical protein [Lachnospiraceae bacterium]
MERFEIVKKKIIRHTRYVYSKDSKRKLEYYGLAPDERMQAEAEKITMSISELIELKLALESLSDLELIIVQQNIMGNEKLETISKRLNISIRSVKRKKKAALLKLREYLK